jgi:hypothetical protein
VIKLGVRGLPQYYVSADTGHFLLSRIILPGFSHKNKWYGSLEN